MGIVKLEDVIAWQDGEKILCDDCAQIEEAKPLTEQDFADDDIVECDNCEKRIK